MVVITGESIGVSRLLGGAHARAASLKSTPMVVIIISCTLFSVNNVFLVLPSLCDFLPSWLTSYLSVLLSFFPSLVFFLFLAAFSVLAPFLFFYFSLFLLPSLACFFISL